MRASRIGIDVADLRLGVREAFQQAAAMQFALVEAPATDPDLAPRHLTDSGRRHLIRYLSGLGLNLTALTADVPHTRLTHPATVEERIDRTRDILRLAADLRVPVVAASVGALTDPQTGEPSTVALEALAQIGAEADRTGRIYAVRPSADPAERLAEVLARLGCPSLRVCMDPAELVMSGVNPVPIVERCANLIALSHARDGTAGLGNRVGHETPLGEGEVDLVGLWKALAEAGYGGPHIIRRYDSQRPQKDLIAAREYLAKRMPEE